MLDRETRDRIMLILRELPGRYGITVVHVTHDWDEAYSLADRVYVMSVGKIIEEGEPEQVFNRPRSVFTARFLGFQNIIRGIARGDLVIINNEVELSINGNADGEVYVCIRPEWIRVMPYGGIDVKNQNVLMGVVNEVIRSRIGYQLSVSVSKDLVLTALSATAFKPGDKVLLVIPRESIHVIGVNNAVKM
ncbi:hypothetical protein [Vulcanisaeta sp. JCM 16161]|uniref:TOBE domain-containing protein n=1 Tax=Vulcanisaeta sp. JCM 16161 TaxID=1295372 RepID=UPI001FB3CE08|nr:TOBE domain-containing protein [Vulcanisaeta sp. JCM 16161]